MRGMPVPESTRGYVEVHGGGRGTFHLPHGGRWVGGTVEVTVKASTPPGVYRCHAEALHDSWWVTLGKKVEPKAEAKRLEELAKKVDEPRTRLSGVEGYQEMEWRSRAGHAAKRAIQRHFAELLARL